MCPRPLRLLRNGHQPNCCALIIKGGDGWADAVVNGQRQRGPAGVEGKNSHYGPGLCGNENSIGLLHGVLIKEDAPYQIATSNRDSSASTDRIQP